jgi:hypothetical protein
MNDLFLRFWGYIAYRPMAKRYSSVVPHGQTTVVPDLQTVDMTWRLAPNSDLIVKAGARLSPQPTFDS